MKMKMNMKMKIKMSLIPLLLAACGGGGESSSQSGEEEECGVLRTGDVLEQDEQVDSCNGAYTFVHQSDGNVVLYAGASPLYATDTVGLSSDRLTFREDGDLVLTGTDDSILFSSGTSGNPGAIFFMQDDGNAVIYDANDEYLWDTGTAGGGGGGGGGCTANVDCGDCQRCELSTGSCVARLSC